MAGRIDHPDFDDRYHEIGWTLSKYVFGGGHSIFSYSKRHLMRRGSDGERMLCGARPGIVQQGNWIGECKRCNAIARKELGDE